MTRLMATTARAPKSNRLARLARLQRILSLGPGRAYPPLPKKSPTMQANGSGGQSRLGVRCEQTHMGCNRTHQTLESCDHLRRPHSVRWCLPGRRPTSSVSLKPSLRRLYRSSRLNRRICTCQYAYCPTYNTVGSLGNAVFSVLLRAIWLGGNRNRVKTE